MDRNTAQLNQDYGVKVGSIGGIPVLAPTAVPTDGQAFCLIYSDALKATGCLQSNHAAKTFFRKSQITVYIYFCLWYNSIRLKDNLI